MKNKLSEEYQVAGLKDAIKGEIIAGKFYKYLSKCMLDDNMRSEFEKFADEEAVRHRDLLNERLKEITGRTYRPDMSKLDITAKVRSFSLIEAFTLAKESEAFAVEFYKQAKKHDKRKYQKMYAELLKDENKHWKYLYREKRNAGKRHKYTDVTGIQLYSFMKDCLDSLKNKKR